MTRLGLSILIFFFSLNSVMAEDKCYKVDAPLAEINDYYMKANTETLANSFGTNGKYVRSPVSQNGPVINISVPSAGNNPSVAQYRGSTYGILGFAGTYTENFCNGLFSSTENSGLLFFRGRIVYGRCGTNLVRVGQLKEINCPIQHTELITQGTDVTGA